MQTIMGRQENEQRQENMGAPDAAVNRRKPDCAPMPFDLNANLFENGNEEEEYLERSHDDVEQNSEVQFPEQSYEHAEMTDEATNHVQFADQARDDQGIEEGLFPDPVTNEEKEMDRMFEADNYPAIHEIIQARAPQDGMVFDSLEEAFRFFTVYERRVGFAVKKDSSYRSRKTGQVQRIEFTCNKHRGHINTDSATRQRRSNKIERTECKVLMRLKKDDCKWVVYSVNLQHNHDLAPSQWLVRFMSCHKKMSPADKHLVEILQESRVPPRKVMSIFRSMRGSFRNIPFDAKYVSNMMYQERLKHKNRDIKELLQKFKDVQKKTKSFYYTLQIDEDNNVRSVFWTDVMGRADYKMFGQFLSFTTYTICPLHH